MRRTAVKAKAKAKSAAAKKAAAEQEKAMKEKEKERQKLKHRLIIMPSEIKEYIAQMKEEDQESADRLKQVVLATKGSDFSNVLATVESNESKEASTVLMSKTRTVRWFERESNKFPHPITYVECVATCPLDHVSSSAESVHFRHKQFPNQIHTFRYS